ncbi:hypothetical protein [Corallococcus terminator]|uniref:Uncharacterized protein n=1 Tax=Corallococcus terminator TaxID=2316733 RepID=A0A3A8IY40_9BACT|nr:hypothetical protein [Corallococcus terminator]RKG84660.1 hypothetical protein D7V88_21415 [Corallococcus terminator]
MLLELSNDESRVLKETLDAALGTLREERTRTEARELQDALGRRYALLQSLQRRLEPLVDSEEIYA